MSKSISVEEKALKKSMAGALLLAVWGLVMAGVSGSSVVLLDGMFNMISGIMSYFSIEITRWDLSIVISIRFWLLFSV